MPSIYPHPHYSLLIPILRTILHHHFGFLFCFCFVSTCYFLVFFSFSFFFSLFFRSGAGVYNNFQSTSGANQNWLVGQIWLAGHKLAITDLCDSHAKPYYYLVIQVEDKCVCFLLQDNFAFRSLPLLPK